MRRTLIFLANSIFYIWGGVGAFLLLCGLSLIIWFFHIEIFRRKRKNLLIGGIALSVLPLLMIKYTSFIIDNINAVFGISLSTPSMIVPVGISFFTFEAISLLSDTYEGKIEKRISLVDTYLYLSFFPTVTSGPIIRFLDFQRGLEIPDRSAVSYGPAIERIAIGLCKKVLLADKLAVLADYYFNGVAAGKSYSPGGLWLGSIAYSLQLFYDFSGYSDMAIGMGQLLGFRINENFNHPYLANSISDFWKRWHMSLSQWFRDYIYIPLGGNRCPVPRHIVNMLIVWLLTGVWHGADWSFILWGFGYFVLLIAEKYVPPMKKIGSHWYGHLYALFFVNLLWIPFRASGLSVAGKFIAGMFRIHSGIPLEDKALAYLPLVLLSAVLCLPWSKLSEKVEKETWFGIIKGTLILALTGLAVSAVVNASYTPYIYGSF